MSKVKFSENMFLEVNELQRLVKFIGEDGYKKLFKSLIKTSGIIKNEGNTNFKPSVKVDTENVLIVRKGLAYDDDLNAISMSSDFEAEILDTGSQRWVILSRDVSNLEAGKVSIDIDGSLSGVGTEFTKVLRGQPNFPTKVKLDSELNFGEYEVVKVISDTSAILAGAFQNEGGLKYGVIGTFTPGFQPLEENRMIYEYDHYNIRVVDSTNKPMLNAGEYIIAGITFDNLGVMKLTDERINHMFNEPYLQVESSTGEASDNPIVSLLSVSNVGISEDTADIELILEHGYKVNRFELSTGSTSDIFKIEEGQSNFFGSGVIPDGFFKGWKLLNRLNMKHVYIDNNSGKDLLISQFDSSMIEGSSNDFIIVPNYEEIEYEIKVSNNVDSPIIPFYFKGSVWNANKRTRVYTYFKSVAEDRFDDIVEISIRYRMLDDSGKQRPFKKLPVSQYKNIKGVKETLSNSSFKVNTADIKPVEKQRNYS